MLDDPAVDDARLVEYRDVDRLTRRHGPLRDDLSVHRAAQVVWTLTSPEVHLLMRDTGGWSQASYREWLERAIADGILRQP